MTYHRSDEELHRSLTNQAPTSDTVTQRMEAIREPAKELATAINSLVPEGREKSTAISKLEEVVMWAIKGIALNQEQIG